MNYNVSSTGSYGHFGDYPNVPPEDFEIQLQREKLEFEKQQFEQRQQFEHQQFEQQQKLRHQQRLAQQQFMRQWPFPATLAAPISQRDDLPLPPARSLLSDSYSSPVPSVRSLRMSEAYPHQPFSSDDSSESVIISLPQRPAPYRPHSTPQTSSPVAESSELDIISLGQRHAPYPPHSIPQTSSPVAESARKTDEFFLENTFPPETGTDVTRTGKNSPAFEVVDDIEDLPPLARVTVPTEEPSPAPAPVPVLREEPSKQSRKRIIPPSRRIFSEEAIKRSCSPARLSASSSSSFPTSPSFSTSPASPSLSSIPSSPLSSLSSSSMSGTERAFVGSALQLQALVGGSVSEKSEPIHVVGKRIYGFIMLMKQQFPPQRLINQLSPVLKNQINDLFKSTERLVRVVGFDPVAHTMTIGINETFDFLIHTFVTCKFAQTSKIGKVAQASRRAISLYWSETRISSITPVTSSVVMSESGGEAHRTFHLPGRLITALIEIQKNNPNQILPITANLFQRTMDSCFTYNLPNGTVDTQTISDLELFEGKKKAPEHLKKSFAEELEKRIDLHQAEEFKELEMPISTLKLKSYINYNPK